MTEQKSTKASRMNIRSLLFTIVGGIIIATFAWWLNSEKYDLRYTLSEKIPFRFGGVQEEAVQQIEVKNLSKKPVERIQVKLPPIVATYEISKNSQGDNIDHFKTEKDEEFIYPSLPPQGSFRLVFKTQGIGILKSMVRVTHSKGEATFALESGGRAGFPFDLFFWLALSYFILMGLFSTRSVLIDSLDSKAEYSSEYILKRSAPLFVDSERWMRIRDKAIGNLCKSDDFGSVTDIEGSACYGWLNRDKPEFLSDEEWLKIGNVLTKRLESRLGWSLNHAWSPEEVLKCLRVKKPEQYAPAKWEELRETIQKQFVVRRNETLNRDELVARLQESKPEGIEQTQWNESQIKLAGRLAELYEMESACTDSPLGWLKRQNLSVLPKDTSDRLLDRAYRRELNRLPDLAIDENAERFLREGNPAWMSNEDYSKYKSVAERTMKNAQKEALNELLHGIVNGTSPSKMELQRLNANLREKLLKLDEQIRVAREKNQSETERITKESGLLAKDREKVLKQLVILNNLLAEPASIDRIESYDNPFAPGNFELLQRVSKALRASDKH